MTGTTKRLEPQRNLNHWYKWKTNCNKCGVYGLSRLTHEGNRKHLYWCPKCYGTSSHISCSRTRQIGKELLGLS